MSFCSAHPDSVVRGAQRQVLRGIAALDPRRPRLRHLQEPGGLLHPCRHHRLLQLPHPEEAPAQKARDRTHTAAAANPAFALIT